MFLAREVVVAPLAVTATILSWSDRSVTRLVQTDGNSQQDRQMHACNPVGCDVYVYSSSAILTARWQFT